MKIKTALILCAGFGKRLNPITLKNPKPLLRINNITLLENTINLIKKLGIKKILINTFYQKDKIKFFLNKNNFDVSIEIVEDGNQILIIADLTIGKGPFKDTYKSNVKFDKENSVINVTNIGGPLNYLENNWKFNETKFGTEINFDIDFEIENKFLNILMTKSFEFGLNKIADAFQERAKILFS